MPCLDTQPTRRAAVLSTNELRGSITESNSKSSSSEEFATARHEDVDFQDIILDDVSAPEPVVNPISTLSTSQNIPQTESGSAVLIAHCGDLNQTPVLDDVLWENMAWDNVNFQADLAHIYQDMDFRFDDELPSIHAESWLSFDLPQDKQQGGIQVNDGDSSAQRPAAAALPRSKSVSGAHEAFKKSPWLWTPSKQDHAYSNHSQLAIDEANIMASPEITSPGEVIQQPLPTISDHGARDEMLQMIIQFSKSAIKIRSFPSHNLLNVLMQAFFVKDSASVDSWIHMASFSPNKCRTELLAGLISAGSTMFAVPNIWKMGLALQDIVKLAICDALDHDNRLARDLQTYQTFLLWVDIGLWSGFRRKMEIAEGFAHHLPTVS